MQRQLPLYILKLLTWSTNYCWGKCWKYTPAFNISENNYCSCVLFYSEEKNTHSQTPTLNPLYTNYLLAKYLRVPKIRHHVSTSIILKCWIGLHHCIFFIMLYPSLKSKWDTLWFKYLKNCKPSSPTTICKYYAHHWIIF